MLKPLLKLLFLIPLIGVSFSSNSQEVRSFAVGGNHLPSSIFTYISGEVSSTGRPLTTEGGAAWNACTQIFPDFSSIRTEQNGNMWVVRCYVFPSNLNLYFWSSSDYPPDDPPEEDQCLEGEMNEDCCEAVAENYCIDFGGVFSFQYFGIDAIGGERCEYVCFDDRPQEPEPDPDPDPNPEPTPNPIPDPINPEPEPDPNPVPEPPPESGENQAVLHYLDILARQAKYDPRVYSELFRLNRNSQLNAEELHRLTNETNERLANNGIILDNVLDELVKANDRGELVLPSDGELDDSLLDWRLDGISDLSPNIVSNWDYFRGSARSLLVEAGLNPDDAEFDVDDWELDVIDISERADDFDLFLPDASCIGVKMYDINGLMFPINWTPLCDIFHWVGMLVVFSAWFSTPFIVFNTSKK